MTVTQSQLPRDYPPITIINNINTDKTDKKEDKPKDEKPSFSYIPGRLLYAGAELALINYVMFNSCAAGEEIPAYRLTYLVSAAAGAAFGLYKAINSNGKSGVKIGLEQRAEAFGNGSGTTKATMFAELGMIGPVALRALEGVKGTESLGNLVAIGWGLRYGSDLANYAYQSLASK